MRPQSRLNLQFVQLQTGGLPVFTSTDFGGTDSLTLEFYFLDWGWNSSWLIKHETYPHGFHRRPLLLLLNADPSGFFSLGRVSLRAKAG
jgi:hypothetical protein